MTSKPSPTKRTHMIRLFWLLAGGFAVMMGILGIILPLLPTTPFLLLAAFCFARGSERLHHWLISHKVLGPPIRDWENHGAISSRAKRMAFITIALVPLITYAFGAGLHIILIQIVVLSCVTLFIATRPRPPQEQND